MQYTYKTKRAATASGKHWRSRGYNTTVKANKRKVGRSYTMRIGKKSR